MYLELAIPENFQPQVADITFLVNLVIFENFFLKRKGCCSSPKVQNGKEDIAEEKGKRVVEGNFGFETQSEKQNLVRGSIR